MHRPRKVEVLKF